MMNPCTVAVIMQPVTQTLAMQGRCDNEETES